VGNDTEKTDVKTDKPWLFKPGESGNPDGRPKGQKNYLTLIEEALEKEAKKTGITYWEQLAKWSFVNPQMAIAVLKKFVPDKQHTEISGDEPLKIIIEDADKESESN